MDTDLEDDFSLANSCIAVVGLGLMGGSLALGLRGHCARLIGIDPDRQALEQAQFRKAVDESTAEISDGLLRQADVIILAVPVNTILELLAGLPAWHSGPAIVLDVGSTKTQIVQAMDRLPDRFDALGGHPMAGKEKLTLAYADPSLFHEAVFAFCPSARTAPRARASASQLCQVLQATPLWIDAPTHDRWVAATSHLPYLISIALSRGTPLESAALVGPGFRSTTRLAATPTSMMLDVLETNQADILAALDGFRGEVDRLEALLCMGDFKALQAFLDEGRAHHAELLSFPQEGMIL